MGNISTSDDGSPMKPPSVMFFAALLTPFGVASAQLTAIDVGSPCRTCAVVMTPLVTLGMGDRNPISGPPLSIVQARDSSYYVVDIVGGVVNAFAKDGRFLRQIGMKGAGPGEYESARVLLTDLGNRLHVLDGHLARRSIFAADGRLIQTTRLPVSTGALKSAALMPNGHVITNAILRDPTAVGYVLQESDALGNQVRLFDENALDPRRAWVLDRFLWPRSNGELWVARPFEYTVELYSPDRVKRASLARVADWYTPLGPTQIPSDGVWDVPPTSRVAAIWEDREGLLWTMIHVPSADWKPGPARGRGAGARGRVDPDLINRPRYDTVIEVIDPVAGKLVTTLRVQRLIGYAFSGGLLAEYRETASGEPTVQVSRVHLKR